MATTDKPPPAVIVRNARVGEACGMARLSARMRGDAGANASATIPGHGPGSTRGAERVSFSEPQPETRIFPRGPAMMRPPNDRRSDPCSLRWTTH